MVSMNLVLLAVLMPAWNSPPIAALGGLDGTTEYAVNQVMQQNPGARIVQGDGHTGVSLMTGLRYAAQGDTPRAQAEVFLRHYTRLTLANSLQYVRTTRSARQAVVHFGQVHGGHPVLDRSATVTIDEHGLVRAFNSDASPIQRHHPARIAESAAKQIALEHVARVGTLSMPVVGEPGATRGVVVLAGLATDVYEIHTSRVPLVEHLVIRVDAHMGQVLSVRNAVIH